MPAIRYFNISFVQVYNFFVVLNSYKLIKIFRIINILNGMIYFLSCGFEPFGKNKELKSKVIFDE